MAPEQLEDQPYSREIDIWALGAVVYWLCSTNDARLCTADELLADEARGTGCSFDLKLVWSSEACLLGDGNAGFLAAGGSSLYSGKLKRKCLAGDDTTPSVRCCADV